MTRSVANRLAFISFLLHFLLSFAPHVCIAESWEKGGFDEDKDMDEEPDGDIWERRTEWFYNRAKLDAVVKYAGSFSVRLELKRDAISLIAADYIRVEDDRSYTLGGWVRTEGLEKSAARLSLHWYDKMGIPMRVSRSDSVAGTQDWTKVVIRILRVPRGARFVRLSVDLEGEDVKANAWFDSIYLLEEIRLFVESPGHPGKIFAAGEDVKFHMRAPGVEPGLYDIDIKVYGFDLEVVWPRGEDDIKAYHDIVVSDVAPLEMNVVPGIQGPGHYVAVVAVYQKDAAGGGERHRVAERRVKFGIKPPPVFRKFLARDLCMDLGAVKSVSKDEASVIRASGVGGARLNVWEKALGSGTYEEYDSGVAELLKSISLLRGQGLLVEGAISYPPYRVGDKRFYRREDADIFDLLVLPPEEWKAQLTRTIEDFSGYVGRWRLGKPGRAEPTAEQVRALGEAIQGIKAISEFHAVGVAWGKNIERLSVTPISGVSFGDFSVGMSNVNDDKFWADLKALSSQGVDVQISLELDKVGDEPPRHVIGRQVGSLAKAIVRAKLEGSAQVISIGPFMDSRGGLLDEHLEPNPAYMVLGVIADLLGGPVGYLGDISDEPGVVVHAFAKMDQVVCVAWSVGGEVPMNVYLGEGVRRIDLVGRSKVLSERTGSEVELVVSEEPSFLVVMDKPWLMTQLAFRPMTSSVDSRSGEQDMAFGFTNEFSDKIAGRITIELPQGWESGGSSQIRRELEMDPSSENMLPFKVSLPKYELLGMKDVWVNLDFNVGGKKKFARFRRRVSVVSDVELDARVNVVGDRAIIAIGVKNMSKTAISYKLLANVFDENGILREKFERAPKPLAVGDKREESFRLTSGAETEGRVFEILLREQGGDRFLNIRRSLSPQ